MIDRSPTATRDARSPRPPSGVLRAGHRRPPRSPLSSASSAWGDVQARTPPPRAAAARAEIAGEVSRFDQFVEPSAVQTRHLYSCPNVVTLMDRINQHVAAGVDALHPAVLRMIDLTCRGAARHG